VTTLMLSEALQAPDVIAQMYRANEEKIAILANKLIATARPTIVTIARGSSDHAANFFGYLVMARLGRWVTSLPMSLITMEKAPLTGAGVASFAFSQSGKSPDLIVPTDALGRSGALTVAFVNDELSPLAKSVEHCVPLHAGRERSVAATKSFIAQLAASVQLVSHWSEDRELIASLEYLPDTLAAAAKTDWSHAIATLLDAERLFVIGRGTGLAIAHEAALKFKETCGIQAEAFSGAEVKHGPMTLIEEGYPLLIFAPRGPTQPGLIALAHEMRERGARVLLAAPRDGSAQDRDVDLPMVAGSHIVLDPISAVQSFYPLVEALARARGRNPDAPRFLSKVTLTH
jgi:glutamine---fructose-6-phosphate transaminase (isomerizing)